MPVKRGKMGTWAHLANWVNMHRLIKETAETEATAAAAEAEAAKVAAAAAREEGLMTQAGLKADSEMEQTKLAEEAGRMRRRRAPPGVPDGRRKCDGGQCLAYTGVSLPGPGNQASNDSPGIPSRE